MSAAGTARRLVACYPPAWRERYGDELAELIVLAAGDGWVGWATRLDVLGVASRERVRAALGLTSGGDPADRAREGAVRVLCAWTALALAWGIVVKTSEHWGAALDGRVPTGATVAFDTMRIAALTAAGCVIAGMLVAAPSTRALLRREGLAAHPRPLVRAVVCVVAALGATAALVAWANHLSTAQRSGHDALYAAAFVTWALLCAAALIACTAAAVSTARRMPALGARAARLQSFLAAAAALAMTVMAVGLIVWWVAVALRSPAALVGSSAGDPTSPWVPALILAALLMIGGTVTATVGAARALTLRSA